MSGMAIQSAYAKICAEACEWRRKGIRTELSPASGLPIHVTHVECDPAGNTTEYEDCTAPSRDACIERLASENAELRADKANRVDAHGPEGAAKEELLKYLQALRDNLCTRNAAYALPGDRAFHLGYTSGYGAGVEAMWEAAEDAINALPVESITE